ncbi:MAG: DNA-processing protein DprA [Actinomycetes bacterium]
MSVDNRGVRALTDDQRARAALSRLTEPDDPGLGALVASHGAEQVLAQIVSGELPSARVASYQARLPALDVDADLERAARFGARLLTPGCDDWPTVLDDLGPRRPLALWVSGGGRLGRLTGRAVAVVGARACTAYGEHVAAEVAAGLCDRGWTVVSGAAFGIDAAAHRGALAVDGSTVAVLACGVDVVYPSAHGRLLSGIRDGGVVVSELPPGCRPTKSRFLGRNRVIAALGRGTVVVEAALRSGAMNTAGHAASLSREVMAVPGPVTSPMSAGCHELVRSAAASLVTDAADIVDLVGEMGADAAPLRRGETRPHDGLDEVALRVLDALPVRQRAGPSSVARVAGLDVATVLRTLAVLSVRGLAESAEGTWRRAPAPRQPG